MQESPIPAEPLVRWSEESLAHFRHDCELRIHHVRDFVLHPLAKQEAGAAFVKPITIDEPVHQLGGRVLQRFIKGSLERGFPQKKAEKIDLPPLPPGSNASVIAPAEVEIE